MARSFAQIRPEMWLDDEWRALTPGAQHLYLLVLTDPELSYAGVADWRPARILPRAAEWSMLELMRSAVELSYSYFLVFDQDTEEVLVRSFLRWDGLMKQPRMAVSMANAFGTIGSNKIRAALVHELSRLRKEHPEWGAWEKPQVKTVMRQSAIPARELEVDLDMPLGVDLPIGLPERQPRVSVPPTPTPAPTPTPSPISKEIAVDLGSSYSQAREETSSRRDKTSRIEVAS